MSETDLLRKHEQLTTWSSTIETRAPLNFVTVSSNPFGKIPETECSTLLSMRGYQYCK